MLISQKCIAFTQFFTRTCSDSNSNSHLHTELVHVKFNMGMRVLCFFRQNLETFDVLHAFLSLNVQSLSTLKNSPVFMAHPVDKLLSNRASSLESV